MNKIFIVAKREFFKVVKKRTFWLTTLLFPVFIVVISLISGLSAQATEDLGKKLREEENDIIIVDDSGLVNKEVYKDYYQFEESKETQLERVKTAEIDALIYFPDDLTTEKLEIYIQDKGLFSNTRFDFEGQEILKQSILLNLPQELSSLVNKAPESDVTVYSKGEVVDASFNRFIVPAVFTAIYFTLTMFATSYLLMSVSEEKENRIIEIVLSTVSPKQLVWGKILGQVAVVITQVAVLMALSVVALILISKVGGASIPIDLSQVVVTPLQIIVSLAIVILSFLTIAGVMVGAGAIMPTYKEAQGLSTVFVILAVAPLYFFTILLAEPSGTIAKVLSYVPLTSGLVLIFRSSLNALEPIEIVLGLGALVIYAYLSLVLAHKLFEIGSLEYGKRLGLKEIRGK
jgi:ABC-2 type transport system permease protein